MHKVSISWSGEDGLRQRIHESAKELGATVEGDEFTFTSEDVVGLRRVVDEFLERCSIIERGQG